MGFVSSIVGGILGSRAASKASNAKQQGAQQAQKIEQQGQANALQAQDAALGNVTSAEQPYQALGSTAANALAARLGTFQAPSLTDAESTPGYQFRLSQGLEAINRNAAANGTLMSGNTGKALTDYATGLAQSTYQQDYENALNTYMANINPLLSATGLGLSSTGQLAGANLDIAGNKSGINMRGAEDQAQEITNAANARASGYLGRANAWSNAVGNAVASPFTSKLANRIGIGGWF